MNTLKVAKTLKTLALATGVAAALAFASAPASAHCDAVDGPVAGAARQALDTGNVNVVLPYVAPEAEAELTAAFRRVVAVRAAGPDAKALADRHFLETAVRLHRAGEGAPYTGLRPAGVDYGPAIPAAERALRAGDVKPLLDLLTAELQEAVTHDFAEARGRMSEVGPSPSSADVPMARTGVDAEFDFIRQVEEIFLAIHGDGAGHED